ncbi:MAG: class I SAM-dependent methyltransferase [Blastocatellia bacterium]
MKQRTKDQIKEHYEIEKVIADRLRASSREERTSLYTLAYDELFQKVPHHPLLTEAFGPERSRRVEKEMGYLRDFLRKDSTYLEVGPGDCLAALEVAKEVRHVYAIDVSNEVTKRIEALPNFELILSDGVSVPVPENSIDIAYSNQLMEHLHPDDAIAQLKNLFRSLKPGAVYLCITPNRLSGPHDISRWFDSVATGLHLKEYTVTELNEIFKAIGFVKMRILLRAFGLGVSLPIFAYGIAESVLSVLPQSLRKLLTFNKVSKFLLGFRILGEKPA